MIQLPQRFLEVCRKKTVFLGCSGGLDSMVLLALLQQHQLKIHVLHVNYHKRDQASDLDMQFVIDYCEQHQIPYSIKHYRKQEKGNFQANARDFRYTFFEQMAKNKDAIIALAHHADDQVETFLMHLMRNSGLRGLAGIPYQRANIYRPLLNYFKNDLHKYAQANNIVWREDQSNHEKNYLRNNVRLSYIPEIESQQKDFKKSVLKLVDVFQKNQLLLEKKMTHITTQIKKQSRITISTFEQMNEFEQYELWRQLGQTSNTFHRFQNILKLGISKHIKLIHPFQKIIREKEFLTLISSNEIENIPALKIQNIKHLPNNFSKNELYLNQDKIIGDLRVRKWEIADKVKSIGVNGSQLVSKIIKDAKISLSQRKQIYVVHDDKNIHWVVGLKIARIANAEKNNQNIIQIQLKND